MPSDNAEAIVSVLAFPVRLGTKVWGVLEFFATSSTEPAEDLLELEGMDKGLAYLLASKGVVTREDLAELATDDLLEIKEMDEEQAAALIMKAREHWFEAEQQA